MEPNKRLVLIGNGFDLAHGLKTSYKDFLNWYMCQAFDQFWKENSYDDHLLEMKHKYAGFNTLFPDVTSMEEVISWMSNDSRYGLSYKSKFFGDLINQFNNGSRVNIECQYYGRLKNIFNSSISKNEKHQAASQLNDHFDCLISKLSQYLTLVNNQIRNCKKLNFENSNSNIKKAFTDSLANPVTFLNFNYTDTLITHNYAYESEVIYIHGQAAMIGSNPIIFGYGDETDSGYQAIEDCGDNVFLDHIKSFGYFKTDKYSKLISLIDSDPYVVYIVGHSCGLSDRVLLSEIFEHQNCAKIEIFYHERADGTDNFKELTQEISRHFKPENKGMFRRKLGPQDPKNVIPQN